MIAAVALLVLGAAPPPAPSFLKGQTHAHSGNSGDSATVPRDVLRWYAARGYDFVVFTDHNFVTVVPQEGRTLAIAGAELTQNEPDCEPPPERGLACLLHVNALFLPESLGGRVRIGPRGRSRFERYRRAVQDT